MKIYIDKDFRCYTEASEDREEHESSFFDERSKRFIEGYRFIPAGRTWIRDDGVEFQGEMICPMEDPEILERLDELEKLRESVVTNSEYIIQVELEKAMNSENIEV